MSWGGYTGYRILLLHSLFHFSSCHCGYYFLQVQDEAELVCRNTSFLLGDCSAEQTHTARALHPLTHCTLRWACVGYSSYHFLLSALLLINIW